jgi:hypothetical protein
MSKGILESIPELKEVTHTDNVVKSELMQLDDVPSVIAGSTRIVTDSGAFTVESLVGSVFYVIGVNNNHSITTVEPTQLSAPPDVYCVTTVDSNKFYCSGNMSLLVFDATGQGGQTIPTNKIAVKNINNSMKLITRLAPSLGTSTNGSYNDGYVLGLITGIIDGIVTWTVPSSNTQQQSVQIISNWITSCDQTMITGTSNHVDGSYIIRATNSLLRARIDGFGLQPSGIPSAVWTYSDTFRRGYIDSVVSHYSMIDTIPSIKLLCKKELVPDIVELLRLYGVMCAYPAIGNVCINIATFSHVFQLSNQSLQSVLDKSALLSISQFSTTAVLSVEKITTDCPMYRINIAGGSNFRTSIGFCMS